MSAFVCILERSGGGVDPGDLDRLSAPLGIHGNQVSTFCRGPVGIAVRHRGDPATRRRHGPLEDPATGLVVAVAGRFSPVIAAGRSECGGPAARGHEPAADALLALSRRRWDEAREADAVEGFLAGVSGPFVLVVARLGKGSIEVARDHLGSCKVYYWLDRNRLIAASEPAAILHHGVSRDLDEASIARFLGFRFGLSERSYFREIRELPPAHRLRVTAGEARVQRYWRFVPPPAASLSPEEITAGFRRRLAQAIADDVAGLEPRTIALSLSGGLDSTAIAALAPRGVRAFSWTLDDDPAGDERGRIELVSRRLDLPIHWVPGDGLHPLCDDFANRFVDENSPYLNPFSALKQRLYEAARAAGCRRVLVGDGGDALFAASEYWLRDALAEGAQGAFRSLAGAAWRALRGDRLARRALARALFFSRYPRVLRRHPAPWLTVAARDLLGEEKPSPILPSSGQDGARHELSVGFKHTELESEEQRLFARCGVDRGNPFWSWPLLELTIHLAAHWYHRDRRSKILTRESFLGLLPEEVLEGGHAGSLAGFFLRGLELRREELRATVFQRPRSDWPRYVRREWVEPFLSAVDSIRFGHTILWRVIAYELWYRRLLQGRGGSDARPRREPRVECGGREEFGEDTFGLVYGVAIRGRMPASFKPYLRPAKVGRAEAVDSLEIDYRLIDELPEVKAIWSSQVEAGAPSSVGRFALGRQGDGFSLSVTDLGRGLFQCDQGKITIAWTAEGTGAAHYFFSYALPLWLELQGVPALHGSAVLMGDGAVGFVGASGVGKSVLAAELARLGCALLADDGLVLRRDGAGGWLAFPGPPLLRLWPSALDLLEVAAEGLPRVHESLEKRQFNLPSEWSVSQGEDIGQSAGGAVRLAGLYFLERRPEPGSPLISTLAPGEALVRLIEHSVAAAPAEALGLSAGRFKLLGDVAETVPARRLCLPSGFGSAADIRAAILNDLRAIRSIADPRPD